MKEDFKIIGIRPLEGCNTKYLKLLKVNKYYNFYSNYEILDDKIIHKKGASNNIFNSQDSKSPKINISAIVGANGSGKSTISELVFVTIYNISVINNVLIDNDGKSLKLEENINVELCYHRGKQICRLTLQKDRIEITNYVMSENNEYCITKPIGNTQFYLNDFFYTIAINYSHYALNSQHIGKWVDKIFHKNDGYQTPVVLNPMRTDGNIDINDENHLVYSRLLANILRPSNTNLDYRQITEKQKVKDLHFIPNLDKIKYVYSYEDNKKKKINISFREFFERNGVREKRILAMLAKHMGLDISKNIPYSGAVKRYIIKKLVSIVRTYSPYVGYFNSSEGQFYKSKFEDLIRKLSGDRSHITFKLRQAINYVNNDLFENFQYEENGVYIIPVEKLAVVLERLYGDKEVKLIEFLPPAFFNYDISLVTDSNANFTPSMFSDLSSGEKQLIHSVSSVIYHIVNVNSVSRENGYLKYRDVNIVFDEIELYYHPKLQKKLIKYLIESLKRQSLESISGINICFLTHSPFILSDIPESNILFLRVISPSDIGKNGFTKEDVGYALPQKSKLKTFGANIHTLLADGFFMDEGLIGDFAKQKINDVINFAKNIGTYSISSRSEAQEVIDLIGEPIVKNKLHSLLNQKYEKETELQYYKRRINEIEEREKQKK
ncbi:hypothetical protein EO244_14110 [Ancylomarina salipaludis]|uniref:ATPase AAA-type core domain-containing protein n=1 Tax=Ancylomarina salipaludis TaxID=2501299 RepID=A0A4Q1JIP8_9BACT|nr:ATP-binding protein [Ancylomarina salipaludis]RXQ89497.1 hypothetical protein EO244_14110 [Ancylomarina salipaludis]